MPPRLGGALDALLADDQTGDAALDEGLLDALADALAAGPAEAHPAAPPAAWDRLAPRLALATPPPVPGLDWDAIAAAYVRGAPPAAATDPLPAPPAGPKSDRDHAREPVVDAPAGRTPRRWGRWAAVTGGGLLSAAVALFLLRPVPWTIHPDELSAPRIPVTVRGEAAAGPRLETLAPSPGPQPVGLVELRLRVQSARAIDQASLQLRSLRGEGRTLHPAEGPAWPLPDELRVGLRLPPGVHPIEVSVMDDLQREGSVVIELEVR
jgi:hypothetical protein